MVVSSVLAALHSRATTGEGQWVDVPLADTMLAVNLVEHLGSPRRRSAQRKPHGVLCSRSCREGRRVVPLAEGAARRPLGLGMGVGGRPQARPPWSTTTDSRVPRPPSAGSGGTRGSRQGRHRLVLGSQH
ncbi:CoA transferase [Streptomyces sp. NPDC086519]|uniref:CoA transferase n=1 Tax=Streptomyces sp. NPDC086519 TaxID=3154863 RepID=UPI00341EBDA8